MKYHPIRDPEYFSNRDFIGRHWNRKFIRVIQAVLNSTKGKIGKGKSFFEKAFGRDEAEFEKLLIMPEAMIIYRHFFEENGLVYDWEKAYDSLSDKQKEIVNPIIYSNKFDDFEDFVHDPDCRYVLSFYRIRRNYAEDNMKVAYDKARID